MKKRRCYIYTRVSTSMQVEGYSLEAQKERLRKYADFQEMVIVGEYSDEGKSGKSIEGRQEFMQMLRDIEEGKDRVEFVLVYKLSRFGRNAADVLNSLQRMQDFGVNLICVEDGIDSSKDSGKLMISVLSAVAEIERENILVQTMEGRRQKARDGKWNGGFAPYGYKLLNGELEIAEDEAEIIRIIFDKYIHTNMGVNGIAAYLNEHGYKKKKRQNNTLDAFATSFIFKSKGQKISIPWFIFFFILALVVNTYLLGTTDLGVQIGNAINGLARKTLTITMFFIGASLSIDVVKAVGIKPLIQGVLLWIVISCSTLAYIYCF